MFRSARRIIAVTAIVMLGFAAAASPATTHLAGGTLNPPGPIIAVRSA